MRLLLWASALACLVEPSSAFYPYRRPSNNEDTPTRRSISPIPHGRRSIKAPIQKVAVKRANAFRIIYANNPSVANSTGLNQDGADLSYMISLQFGSSKKLMNMLLDTAAVNTWVMSSNCTTNICSIHNTFGESDSKTLAVSSKPFGVTYGTGSVSGVDATDSVTLMSYTFPLTFGLAENISSEFSGFPMDGICGMGRLANVANENQGVGADTLMDVLVSQGIISSKQFGIRLSRSADGQNNGEVNFGAPDESAYQGSLNYMTTIDNTNGFWEIPLDAAGINSTAATLQNNITLLLDSGTSYILVPSPDAVTLHNMIPGSNRTSDENWTIPCSTTTPITFMIGGKPYTISPKDWVGGQVGGGQCNSNIIGRLTFGPNQWLVGDVFLKNVYTLFDYTNNRIGLGYLQGSTIPTNTITSPQSTTTTTTVPGATASPGVNASGTTATSSLSSSISSPTVSSSASTSGKPSMTSGGHRLFTWSSSWLMTFVMIMAFCWML